MYHDLIALRKKFGHCNVPFTLKKTHNLQIGSEIRDHLRKTCLTKERINKLKLNLNGFSLGVAGREASYDGDTEEVEDDEEVVLKYSYI